MVSSYGHMNRSCDALTLNLAIYFQVKSGMTWTNLICVLSKRPSVMVQWGIQVLWYNARNILEDKWFHQGRSPLLTGGHSSSLGEFWPRRYTKAFPFSLTSRRSDYVQLVKRAPVIWPPDLKFRFCFGVPSICPSSHHNNIALDTFRMINLNPWSSLLIAHAPPSQFSILNSQISDTIKCIHQLMSPIPWNSELALTLLPHEAPRVSKRIRTGIVHRPSTHCCSFMNSSILEKCQMVHHSNETWQDVAPPFRFSRSPITWLPVTLGVVEYFRVTRIPPRKLFKIEVSPQLAKQLQNFPDETREETDYDAQSTPKTKNSMLSIQC
jgi:hypothetical protein